MKYYSGSEIAKIFNIEPITVISKSIGTIAERIERVRKLHKSFDWYGLQFCDTCDLPYPCPTIKALDGEQ